MTKANKLRLCDRALLCVMVGMLASSVQLEATGSRSIPWVWLHVVVGCVFFSNIIWHLYLHFGWTGWINRFRKQKSPVTRVLAIVGALTVVSAVAASFHWVDSYIHSPLGAVHGKLGFLFVAIAVGHTLKRIRFYRSR